MMILGFHGLQLAYITKASAPRHANPSFPLGDVLAHEIEGEISRLQCRVTKTKTSSSTAFRLAVGEGICYLINTPSPTIS
jgi:hypothetical protein